MAFNLQTFKTRTLTAIVFAVVMLLGLFINYWTYFLLFTIIHFGCWLEYQKLIGCINTSYKSISPLHKYGIMLGGFGFLLWMLFQSYTFNNLVYQNISLIILLFFGFVIPIVDVLFNKKLNKKILLQSLLGLLYISLSFGLIIDLYNVPLQKETSNTVIIKYGILGTFTIACMWVNDTMAYIVGSFIGKTPFSKISPKKTWEGTIGGIILCIIAMGLLMNYMVMPKYFSETIVSIMKNQWYIIAAIAAISGTIGDLLESKIKRLAGVKDSGNFMPGHGGFLDRFDSLLIAVIFVWLYIKVVLQ
ncbi:MAG: phosphatidate cytidylyltransferase [Chitinophagaceae bacterium]|nr:phosphatidate cytidylyltransferase [Chitinophagaceae bacterium]MCW5904135.1 phosphatidate cytidylyltransferase [Chitinophagaceae bacterium]